MKEPLRVPFESAESDVAGPRLVHEAGGERRESVPNVSRVLHEARLRGGYSVADAALVLRIQERYLQALEDGRFDDIPGTTYVIGFLRSYAGFLGLDPGELIDAFKREQGHGTDERRLAFPSPTRDSPKPKFWLVLLVLVFAGLAYGGWQYQSTDGQIATDLVADVSTRLTEAVGLDETNAPQEVAAAATSATAVPEDDPVRAEASVPPQPATPAAADPQASAPAETTPAAPSDAAPASLPREDPAPAQPGETALLAADGIPAAETWDEEGPAEATAVAAEEAPPPVREPLTPPPPRGEAAADAASATPAPAPAETAALPDPAAPARQAGTAAPAEAGAVAPRQRPVVAAPLDLASASAAAPVAASGSADRAVASSDARSPEPDGTTAALPEEPPQPAVAAPPTETVTVTALDAAAPPPTADTGYIPKVYGRANFDSRMTITATDDSWVQIQGPGNELLLTRILHVGDSYRVPDRSGLVMVTGNAGGLEVRVDGEIVPPLGPLGVVLRNVPLEPDRLLAGTASGR